MKGICSFGTKTSVVYYFSNSTLPHVHCEVTRYNSLGREAYEISYEI